MTFNTILIALVGFFPLLFTQGVSQERPIRSFPKIAILFLTYDDVWHQSYWWDFFHANEPFYSIYVHSKEPLPIDSSFKPYEIGVKVETTWVNTMRAQIELLREALKEPANEKFIFVSDSTIPFQNFATVYNDVMHTACSIFPYCSNPHQDPTRSGTFWNYHNYQPWRIYYPIPKELQYKHPQWIILNRKHAQLMVDDTEIIAIFDNYSFDNEHYPGTFLAIKGLLETEVINHQTTYDDWIVSSSPASPFTFTDLNNPYQLSLVRAAITGKIYYQNHPYLFGRKFAKECDISPLDPYLSYRILIRK